VHVLLLSRTCFPALQSIQQRADNKEHMLGLVNAERKATNDRKRIERELFDSLRRDKVDSIQKMQVRVCVACGAAVAACFCQVWMA
jgi:hypothetical protein